MAALAAAPAVRGLFGARAQLPARPARGVRAQRVSAVSRQDSVQEALFKTTAAASLAASFLAAGNAQAATEIATLAAGDNRLGLLALLAAPAVGWVLFNIAGPAKNQLDAMGDVNINKKKGMVAGLGLGAASLLAAQNAEAAQQVADLAAGDNRLGLLAFLALPAAGWVLFNIAGPAKNQLDAMGDVNNNKKKGMVAGLGLSAASLLAAQNAEAAQQVADLAAGDNRLGLLALLAAPAVGWVLFNIAGPAKNQLDAMGDVNINKKKGMVAGLGLGAASLLAAQNAEAAQQVADLAASDNRLGLLAFLAVPAVGWVLLNIAGPAKNQLDAMGDVNINKKAGDGKKKK